MVSTLTSLVHLNRNNWYQNRKAPVDRLFFKILSPLFLRDAKLILFPKIRYNRIVTPTLLRISILFLLVMKYIHAKMSIPLYVKTLEIPSREP